MVKTRDASEAGYREVLHGTAAPAHSAAAAGILPAAWCCAWLLQAGLAQAQEPRSGQSGGDRSSDPQALSVGSPIRIQDALSPPVGKIVAEVGSTTTYVNRRNAGVAAAMLPSLKMGVADGFSVNLAATSNFGDSGHNGATFKPSFQWVFFNNHKFDSALPILSVEANVIPRQGSGTSGGSFGVSGQLTKALGSTIHSPRLHLNIEYTHINDDTHRQRPSTYGYGVGLSVLMSDHAALVTDVFYAQSGARGSSQLFGDVGLNYVIRHGVTMSAGGGIGTDRNTLSGRVFLNAAFTFDVFRP